MARTKRSAKLDSRSARLDDLCTEQMHQEPLEPGKYLCYRRPKSGASGSWFARWRPLDAPKKLFQARLGTADDFMEADEIGTLNYKQATKRAEAWFLEQTKSAQLEAAGEPLLSVTYTIGNALDDYFADGERRGMKGLSRDRQRAAAWITPEFGEVEVAKLTRTRIESWQAKMAESPRRVRTKNPGIPAPKPRAFKVPRVSKAAPVPQAPPATDEEKRARKDSANRVLSILKAALNHALDRRRVMGGEAWQSVKPYRGTTSARLRFLSPADQVRLVNACTDDFRELVRGALLTGARYGELARMRVKDFDSDARTVFIAISKSGKPRHVVLTDEGKALFQNLTTGKNADDLVFFQEGKQRWKRDAMGHSWGAGDTARHMADACKAAGLDTLTFHELRHSYASMLVNAGCPLAYVAAQLGHSDTRMTERHYGHISPSALADAIRSAMPKLGLVEPSGLVKLNIQGA